MMSMTVLVLVCIWHAIIPQIAAVWGLETAHTSDTVVLVLLGTVFLAIHVAFVLWIRKRVSNTLKLLIHSFESNFMTRLKITKSYNLELNDFFPEIPGLCLWCCLRDSHCESSPGSLTNDKLDLYINTD